MATVIFDNVDQVVQKTVRPDGRIGGMQNRIDDTVHVVMTHKTEEEDYN